MRCGTKPRPYAHEGAVLNIRCILLESRVSSPACKLDLSFIRDRRAVGNAASVECSAGTTCAGEATEDMHEKLTYRLEAVRTAELPLTCSCVRRSDGMEHVEAVGRRSFRKSWPVQCAGGGFC